jgi:hypothetical protein
MRAIKYVTDAWLLYVEKDYWDVRSNQSEIHKNKVAIIDAKELESIETQIKLLKEALKFYADTQSWDNRNAIEDDVCIEKEDCSLVRVEYENGHYFEDTYGGKAAREALKKLEEMESK